MNVGPFTLRELQIRTVELVRESRKRGNKRILVCAPCGFGKTIVSSAIINSAAAKGNASLFLAGARELIKQKSDKLQRCGVNHSILMAGHQHQISAKTVVASKDTLWSRAYRTEKVPKPDGDLVAVDEAHLGNGPTWQAILADYPDATVIGFTATPALGNGRALPGYDDMVIGATYAELLERGDLVPPRVYAPYVVDMSGVTVNPENGEFVQTQVEQRFGTKELVGDVVQQWRKFAENRATVVFASGVAHAISLRDEFNAAGIPAAHVEADTDHAERERIFSGLESGELKVCTNYGVLRVGVDLPFIECMQFAVSMNSLNSYLQSAGRGFRTHTFADGRRKTDCVLIDHGGNCLDEKSEILTKRGWLGIDDMRDEDTIGTMEMDSGGFAWSKNLGTLRRLRDATLMKIETNYLNLCVTDYHNMVMSGDVGSGSRWRLVAAKRLATRPSNWIIPTATSEHVAPAPLTDHEIGFIGWFLTDGSIEPSTPKGNYGFRNRVRIYQSKNSPQLHHDHIVACLEGCRFRYSARIRRRRSPFNPDVVSEDVVYSVSSGRKSPGGWHRLDEWLHKHIPVDVFERLDERQFGVLLHAMNLGDGCKANRKNVLAIVMANEQAASNLQSIAVRRGYRCNRTWRKPSKPNENGVFIVKLRKARLSTVRAGALVPVAESVATDRVWCVQTETGTIIVRREGCVAIVGNCHRHGWPTEDHDWSLLDDRTVQERDHEIRERKKTPREPICCPVCAAMRESGPVCPNCGHKHQRSGLKLRTVAGELRELPRPKAKKKQQTDESKLWMMCLAVAAHRSGTIRSARVMFRQKTGHWPGDHIRPMPEFHQWTMKVRDKYPNFVRRKAAS